MSHLFPPPPILNSIFTFIFILIAVPASHGDDAKFEECQSPYTCGHLQDIRYPFWSSNIRPQYCGRQGFELKCGENQSPTIEIGDQNFRVLGINDAYPIMKISRDGYLDTENCPEPFPETRIINQNIFNNSENVGNLIFFFDCSGTLSSPDKNIFRCRSEPDSTRDGFYTIEGDSLLKNITNTCSRSIKTPILLTDDINRTLLDGRWRDVLKEGFEVEYNADNALCSACLSSKSKGICGSNQSSNEFQCFCRRSGTCPSTGMHALAFLFKFTKRNTTV